MANPVEKLLELKKRYDERPRERSILIGERDHMDSLSYGSLAESADYLEVDGQFIRTLFIAGYPLVAASGLLDNLIHFNHNADISYHTHEVDGQLALPQLNRKITEFESRRRAVVKKGGIVGPDITDPLDSAIELRDKIQRGQEKLFQMSINIGLRANTLGELDHITKLLKSALATRMFVIKPATYQQLEGMQTILPRGEDLLNQKRNLDSSSGALTFPFMSSELMHENGVLMGVNKSNNSLVILDRYSLHNANSIVFAQSGSGKSYTTKVEILRQLAQGTQVIVIDPEREYENLARSVNGTYINLSATSEQKINPFDTSSTSHTKEQLAEHAQDLIEIISRMVANPDKKDKKPALTAEERAVIDEVILKLYKGAKGKTPSLRKFYALAKKEGLISVCQRLEKYLTGTLEGIFNQPTNVELDNRLVVFDIKDLEESVRQPMMMVISTFVQNKVKANPEKRLLVIDEGWILLQDEESARFVAGMVRRARKYYLGVSIISQQANDFFESKYGRAIASQSSLRILLKQDSTTIKNVVEQFGLSEYEESLLLGFGPGDALIIADQNHVAVRIVAAATEHPLITTDPTEAIKV